MVRITQSTGHEVPEAATNLDTMSLLPATILAAGD
jgi:hypothetical protein